MSRMEGGCACGKVRFSAEVASPDAYLCHCRMCQRSSGNVSLALLGIEQAKVEWKQAPDWYDSSPIARRPFCSSCGTSLGFQFREGSAHMDLTVAAFDDADYFKPTHHFGAESMHEAWLDTRELPQTRSEEYQPLQERWTRAGARPPA
ncbi:GFA family protein [Sphingomonas ginkgonis]|uniref:GFA family protein n=1 Tax=Sphingomonas ginkgonis TaxID=2315330 RepID=A0A429V9V4_9SPHN|nr:GFA family protein [Sphingomonas ginkgonis]RST30763.1 GFA family protein [Sphingomonas ginkgonis]